MSSAAQKIFGIPELLEEIIFQLPNKDILILQRMNKAWIAAVERCGDTQRKLFLRPALDAGHGSARINPCIHSALRYHGFESAIFIRRDPDVLTSGFFRMFGCFEWREPDRDMHIQADQYVELVIHYVGRAVFAPDLQQYKHMLVGDTPVVFRIGKKDSPRDRVVAAIFTTVTELIQACWEVIHEADGLIGEQNREVRRNKGRRVGPGFLG